MRALTDRMPKRAGTRAPGSRPARPAIGLFSARHLWVVVSGRHPLLVRLFLLALARPSR